VIGTDDSVSVVTDKGSEILPDIDTIVFAQRTTIQSLVAEWPRREAWKTYIVGDASDVVSKTAARSSPILPQAYDIARADLTPPCANDSGSSRRNLNGSFER